MMRVLSKFREELKAQQKEIAEAEMLRPHHDAEHGVICGKYQGIQIALDTLENLLRDKLDEESKS